MKITIKTGKDVKKAIKILQKEFDKKDLSQKETAQILVKNNLQDLAKVVENMEAQEFEDWVVNHFF
jgi:hypothetical protein